MHENKLAYTRKNQKKEQNLGSRLLILRLINLAISPRLFDFTYKEDYMIINSTIITNSEAAGKTTQISKKSIRYDWQLFLSKFLASHKDI